MDSTKIVLLRTPVSLGGVQYTEIVLTEPTVKQLITARKAETPVEQMAALVQLNAKLPTSVVEMLGQRDFEECADFLVRFGGDAWKTPGPSSPDSPGSLGGDHMTLSA